MKKVPNLNVSKIWKGKNGQIDIFMDVMSYILFVIIILVFFIMFHVIKGCNNPSVEKMVSNTDMQRENDLFLINLLKTPIADTDGMNSQITVADEIWLYYDDREYEDELEANIHDIMKSHSPYDAKNRVRYTCWEFTVKDEEEIFDTTDKTCSYGDRGKEYNSEIMIAIPLNKDSITLSVGLSVFEYEGSIDTW